MPEIDHVRGIEGHPELSGPPHDPPSSTVPIPPWDEFNEGVVVAGDPAAKPKQFLEVSSTALEDIVARDDDYEEDDDD